MSTRHPEHKRIQSNGSGPARIEYPDGSSHVTDNLLYDTAIKYTTINGTPVTTKGACIKRIVWLSDKELRECQ